MEEEASLEAVEVTVGEMDHSRLAMSHSGELQGRRAEVTHKPELEKEKLPDLETLLRQLLVGSRSKRNSEDSGTWAEAEPEAARVSVWVENNIIKRTT